MHPTDEPLEPLQPSEPAQRPVAEPAPRGRAPDFELRVSDAERDRASIVLREHFAAGRLTLDELAERLDQAIVARTRADLEVVVRDLPDTHEAAAARPVPPARKARRWLVAIMGGVERKRRWRVAEETTAIAVMGGCELDLRQAVFDGDEIVVNAIAVMGGIEIVVPEGMDVDVTGFPLMGGIETRLGDHEIVPGLPTLRVRAFALMGGVEIRAKPPTPRTRRGVLDS